MSTPSLQRPQPGSIVAGAGGEFSSQSQQPQNPEFSLVPSRKSRPLFFRVCVYFLSIKWRVFRVYVYSWG